MVPNDNLSTIQTFKCKDCNKEIIYKRKIVMGLVKIGDVDNEEEKVVYLTCEDGHTYPYTIKGS